MKTIIFRDDLYQLTKNINETLILSLLFEYSEKLKLCLPEYKFKKEFISENIIIDINVDLYLESLIKKNLIKEVSDSYILTLEGKEESEQIVVPVKDKTDSQLEYIKKHWNEIAKVQGFPNVKSFTGERKAQWKRILSKHPTKSFWEAFFAVLADVNCKWLSEAVISDNGFKWFNIDFFYKDQNVDRVEKFVEGFYIRGNVKTTSNMYKDENPNEAVENLMSKNEITYED